MPSTDAPDTTTETTTETIVWRLHLASSPERAFEAVTTDAGRAHLWAESTVENDEGILIVFGKGEAGPCPVLEKVPPSRFALNYSTTTSSSTSSPMVVAAPTSTLSTSWKRGGAGQVGRL